MIAVQMPFRNKYAEMDDQTLSKAVAEGNEAAFRELLNRYQYKILNFAFRFLGDAEEAQDIAQETFLKFYKSVSNFRPVGSLKAYLFTISKNLCIDYVRKKKPVYSDKVQEQAEQNTPLDLLICKESTDEFLSAVQKLPENQRFAVLLRYNEGLSYSEIAKILSVSVSAVESLLVRGRKTLRSGRQDLKND